MNTKTVFIRSTTNLSYPEPSPFHPYEDYPENPFPNKLSDCNPVYAAIRNLFYDLGFDRESFDTPNWNPLGWLIQPGQTVLLKPNWVQHPRLGTDVRALLTHGSIIRAVLDYVYIALRGSGKCIIADAPIQYANWGKICSSLGIPSLIEFYRSRGFTVHLIDLRQEESILDQFGIPCWRKQLSGDPLGYEAVDLGRDSALRIFDNPEQFRVVQYKKSEMLRHHNRGSHEYLIAKTVLDADVIINLPKLKTHKRAGLTCALKNLVGINGSKDWLPHYRKGAIDEGGDEYLSKSWRKRAISDLEDRIMETTDFRVRWIILNLIRILHGSRRLVPFRESYSHGSWWGNETIGGMVVDLNRIALYANKEGELCSTQQRRYFALVDAVIAGEGEGPLHPIPKPCGLVFAGLNPVAVDLIGCHILGFDHHKIPMIRFALELIAPYRLVDFNLNDVRVCIDGGQIRELAEVSGMLNRQFVPPSGWLPVVK